MRAYQSLIGMTRVATPLLLVCGCFFLTHEAVGQDFVDDLIEYLDEVQNDPRPYAEKAPEFARMMQLFSRQQEEFLNRSEWKNPSAGGQPKLRSSFDTPVLSHFNGKDGVPFPRKDESVWRPSAVQAPIAVDMPTPKPAPTARPYQRPSRCERSETKRTVYKQGKLETVLNYDYLYIPEDLVPAEPDEVFGKETSLISVGPNSGKGADIQLEIHDVPCLPYRTRLTNTARYVDTGVNALKNYDGAQAGPGKLHPVIQGKLNGQKGPPAARRR